MKKIISLILIVFLQFSLVSCKNSANNDENIEKLFENYSNYENNIEIHKTETKVYFAENRYVSFKISNDFNVNFENENIVLFDDGTAMAKLYSQVNITPSNANFYKNYSGIFVNPKANTIIRKISTGTKTLKLEETNLENFSIVNAMQITPIFETYQNVGIAIYFPNNQEDEINFSNFKITNNDIGISSSTGTIFYTYLKDNYDLSNLSKTDFNTSIQFEFELSNSNNLNTISIDMDILLEHKFIIFNIIKVGNDFYYLQMQQCLLLHL